MHEMGSMHELDRTLARTLMAEFTRLQLIVGEDFTNSLIALHADLEASYEMLVSGEGCPPEVPADHLTEGKPAPDGTGGSP